MSWREALRLAKFRDVPFHVLSTSTEVGRRNVLHQFPFQDIPYVEDFGREAGVFNVIGYVCQNITNNFNYFEERRLLMNALQAAGPGTLIHPFLGEIYVSVLGKVKVDESFQEGGIARFQMAFVEYGRRILPLNPVDNVNSISGFCDGLNVGITNFFNGLYNPNGPSFLTDALGAAKDLNAGLQSFNSCLTTIKTKSVATVTAAMLSVAAIRTTVSSIIGSPAAIATALLNTFNVFKGIIPFMDSTQSNGESGVNSLLGVTSFGNTGLDTITPITVSRQQQVLNRNVMVASIQAGALSEAMRQAVNVPYTSYNQAYAMMGRILSALDTMLLTLGNTSYTLSGTLAYSDDLYAQLRAAKPAMVIALLNLGASLPTTMGFKVPLDVYPSLRMASFLYNDLTREQDVINRNLVAMMNPALPVGGSVLEVLSE